jgi:hypothetical protein
MERESRQHLVPKAFKKELGLPRRQLKEYVIFIDPKTHADEDRYVMPILQEIRRARKEEGIITTVEDVLQFRLAGWFRK